MLHASSDADRMVCLADRDGCKIVTSIGVIFLQLRPISSGFWKSKIEGPKNYFQMSFLVLTILCDVHMGMTILRVQLKSQAHTILEYSYM